MLFHDARSRAQLRNPDPPNAKRVKLGSCIEFISRNLAMRVLASVLSTLAAAWVCRPGAGADVPVTTLKPSMPFSTTLTIAPNYRGCYLLKDVVAGQGENLKIELWWKSGPGVRMFGSLRQEWQASDHCPEPMTRDSYDYTTNVISELTIAQGLEISKTSQPPVQRLQPSSYWVAVAAEPGDEPTEIEVCVRAGARSRQLLRCP